MDNSSKILAQLSRLEGIGIAGFNNLLDILQVTSGMIYG